MAAEEKDAERLVRVQEISDGLTAAIADKPIGDIQAAIANVLGLMCLRQEDPEALILSTIEIISEVFRAQRYHLKHGAPGGGALTPEPDTEAN